MSLICDLNENFIQLKPMALNKTLYYHERIKWESVDDYRDPVPDADDDLLKVIEEQTVVNEQPVEVHDQSYIRWQMFD